MENVVCRGKRSSGTDGEGRIDQAAGHGTRIERDGTVVFELAQRAARTEGFPGTAEEDDVVSVPGGVIVVLPGGDPAIESAVDDVQSVDFSDGKTFFAQRIVIGHLAREKRGIQRSVARRSIDIKSHAMLAAGAGEGAVVNLQAVGGAVNGLATDEAEIAIRNAYVVGPGVEEDRGIEGRHGD